jgi:Flp pilus assembly pilin Flp
VTPGRGDDGVAMVEYALLLTLITVVAGVAVGVLGDSLRELFELAESTFPG